MIVEYDHDDEQEELGMKVDTIVDDMITDQELGGILVAQAFVDYCQALINAEVIEEDGSVFFGILERSVNRPIPTERHSPINTIIRDAMSWKATKLALGKHNENHIINDATCHQHYCPCRIKEMCRTTKTI